MVKNTEKLRDFEDRIARLETRNLDRNWALLEAMHREAVALGVFPPKDPLEGLEVDIRIARIIHSVPKPD